MVHKGIELSGGCCVLLAFMLLMVPLPWLLASFVAALVHELCHYAAIRLCGADARGLSLYSFAACLPLPAMSRGREVLCALAGPAGGFLLLLFVRWMPRVALCGAMQSCYNLLPIYPFDGGRALQSGLVLFLPPPKAMAICRVFEVCCKWGICILAIYGSFCLKVGIFPLLMAALLLIRAK